MIFANQTFLSKNRKRNASQKKRGTSEECKKIKSILSDFNPVNSTAYIKLTERYGDNLKQTECQKIAEVLSLKLNISLDRDSRRRYPMLLKWFNDNWEQIEPNLKYITLTEKENLDEICNDLSNINQ
ncbi:hypothetical protein M9Y10_042344 [Tritrichomonas musculus]|uniref:Uncharacterized protein n=1 Tax=Tritrichomonas musculus TaxID=1915356 RepID=A0ABR2GNV4_9EUKA